MREQLKRLVDAWRRVLHREEAHWRETAGESVPPAPSNEACASPAKPPTLADLVRDRQNELKRE